MTIGTSYFVSFKTAVMYYRPYGDGPRDVQRKLDEELIHLGKPEIKAGQKLLVIDGGTRYAIEETAAK